jgi:hypothetical protein
VTVTAVHRGILLALAALTAACSSSGESLPPSATSAATSSGGVGQGGAGGDAAPATTAVSSSSGTGSGGALPEACTVVGEQAEVVLASASSSDEHALELTATSADTDWSELGNEALVLDVLGDAGLIGHLVLHQGTTEFSYGMHVGSLKEGESVRVRISSLSSVTGPKSACVGPAKLVPASQLGSAAAGLVHAPIFHWPTKKRFDDIPLVLGWSQSKARYQAVYSNENGGTVAICGGGATGMQAELARWGRGADIEGVFEYGGSSPKWERCDGMKAFTAVQPRMENEHPVLYYGDGHNRVFESRGGYGKSCGSAGDKKSDGDLEGWNVKNPGNDAAKDEGLVLRVRPLPVSLDALGYAEFSGRREALIDTYAPWLYRLTFSELEREGKLDQKQTFSMQSYLYVDVHASDVGGSGDSYCALNVSSGFRVRVHAKSGETLSGPQMTADYFGGADNVKRIAIELKKTYASNAFDELEFDAYDDDGIYWLELGDAFIARPSGKNGATLDYVHKGTTAVNVYVDDNSSNCGGGVNSDGPGGVGYPCVGGKHTLSLP